MDNTRNSIKLARKKLEKTLEKVTDDWGDTKPQSVEDRLATYQ